ncbi:MAG: acetylglutamate kinase [Fimbriimonadales bacterium]
MTSDMAALRAALPYIRSYKDKCFVVKLAGELCKRGAQLDHVAEQLGVLHQVGIRLVVVHGGGKQATDLADRLGVKSEFVNGRRITSEEMLEVAKMAFAGTVNTDIIATMCRQGVPAVGLSGIDAGLVKAKRRPPVKLKDPGTGEIRQVDFGFVGDLQSTDCSVLHDLLAVGYVPVICSLAADDSGQALNVNADTLASRLAQDLGATKYILLSAVDGVMHDRNDPSTLIPELDIARAESLIATGVITGGMLPKITTCIEALQGGVPRVHIVNGLAREALLREIFTNEGSGTLILPGTPLKQQSES